MTRTLGIAAFEYHEPPASSLAKTKDLGVGHCELVTPGDITPATAAEVAEIARAHDVSVTAVASLSKPNMVDDPDAVAAMVQLLDDSVDCAAALSAPFAVTYFGGHPTRPESEALERFVDLVSESVRRAEDVGVTILIENHFSHAPGELTNTAQGCRTLIEAIGSPNFALNFDYCNFAIGGQPLEDAYTVLKPYIRNVHIKDARPVQPDLDSGYHGRIVTDLVHGDFRFVPVEQGITDNRAVLKRVLEDDLDVSVTIEAHVPPEMLDSCFQQGIEFCRREGVG